MLAPSPTMPVAKLTLARLQTLLLTACDDLRGKLLEDDAQALAQISIKRHN